MTATRAWAVLHAVTAADAGDVAVVALGLVGAAALFGLSIAAFLRRQSRAYLLVTLAFGALFARSAVALFAEVGALAGVNHHALEHVLDVVLVALVVAAVYWARTTDRTPDANP